MVKQSDDGLDQVAILRRNRATAAECERILDLPPNGRWTDVQIEFGTDNVAVARVGIILSPEQLGALAQLAASASPQIVEQG